ncbi:hypothetical protein [Jeotgalibacillus haloalkalitolerans]|uniref:Uncharacterized protein n=1 Tax=Jeotgalibacillus haloalkalitolerans TaxID=3104292 RepID=A0ABU5KR93_9BACL|nr:hypothetical protein [Jeotgalibacillus sp. HH7-29]MDZ5713763.1 hypothetical protein [Jeotgalibacillus sp. HH7-29]
MLYAIGIIAGLIGFGVLVDRRKSSRKNLEQYRSGGEEAPQQYQMDNDRKTTGF